MPSRLPVLRGFVLFGLFAGLALAGCKSDPIVPDDLRPPKTDRTGPTPSYGELVKRYNQRVEPVERLWASTEVHLRWRDKDGDKQSEHGDGNLILVRPRRVAMTVGKLGKTMLWAGANKQRYWLFDLQDEGKAYVGAYRYMHRPCSQSLPLPVHPESVPYLMGVMPLDPDRVPREPTVERLRGHFLIEPPHLNIKFLLDPDTARPVRIDLTDGRGRSVVIARLSNYGPVELADTPKENWPTMARDVTVYVLRREARMRLELDHVTDGKADDRINPKIFEFETLRTIHEPAEVIDLDKACKETAAATQPSEQARR